MHERILVAVDGSPASEKALEYVANMVTGRPEHYVHLVHVLPPLAAGHGSSEELDEAAREDRARELLETMTARLRSAGLDADHVDSGYLAIGAEKSMAEALIDVGRDQSCGTIVVGRNWLPRYQELFHKHPADDLVRRAKDYTLWIVE